MFHVMLLKVLMDLLPEAAGAFRAGHVCVCGGGGGGGGGWGGGGVGGGGGSLRKGEPREG